MRNSTKQTLVEKSCSFPFSTSASRPASSPVSSAQRFLQIPAGHQGELPQLLGMPTCLADARIGNRESEPSELKAPSSTRALTPLLHSLQSTDCV